MVVETDAKTLGKVQKDERSADPGAAGDEERAE